MSRKLSIEELVKPRAWIVGDRFTERPLLEPQSQSYLLDYLKTAPDFVGVYEHSRSTKTCKEKVELLNAESGLDWKLHQAVRAVYFKHGGLLHVFVTPELGKRIDTTPCAGKTLGVAVQLPEYVEQGTCTPFVPDWDISPAAGRIQHIYMHHQPEFQEMLADFSIGGRGPDAQKYSLWIPYDAAFRVMHAAFGDMVSQHDIYTMPKHCKGSKTLKPAPSEVRV